MDPRSALELVVGEAEAGRRLDVVLVERVEGMSRARARRFTEEGKVRVNGRRARKARSLHVGDRITLSELPAPADFPAAPDPTLPLVVLREDLYLVVVDKPAGAPSHPLAPGEGGTVAGALVARYPEMAGVGYAEREPGLVHRLDTDTSGALLAARDARTFEALRDLLRSGGIHKRYVALCAGAVIAPAVLDGELATDRKNARRVVVVHDPRQARRLKAKPARTEVMAAETVGGVSLVEIEAPSAHRHQIRAHLAGAGHALLGDALYGGPGGPGLERHQLHASALSFRHPHTGVEVRVVAPLPEALRRNWEAARDRRQSDA